MKTLILACALPLMFPSCATPPPITGQFASKDGQILLHPDGRVEIIVEPRTSK